MRKIINLIEENLGILLRVIGAIGICFLFYRALVMIEEGKSHCTKAINELRDENDSLQYEIEHLRQIIRKEK